MTVSTVEVKPPTTSLTIFSANSELLVHAERRCHDGTQPGYLRVKGNDHKRLRWLGRRPHTLVFPSRRTWPVDWRENLGRRSRHYRISTSDRWGRRNRAEPRLFLHGRALGN